MSALTVNDLTLGFGAEPILHNIALSLEPGECVGLSGPSGSGKSLLGLAILGLLPRAAQITGDIRLKGSNLLRLTEAARRQVRGREIGMVFQEPMTALNPLMSIGAQIAEAAERAADADPRQRLAPDDARVLTLMREVNLPPDDISPRAYPFQLSGGQRQRVAIAMVLAQSPSIIIADEPTTALDMVSQKKVLDVLMATAQRREAAILLISHDQPMLKAYTDRQLAISGGTIIAHQDQAPPQPARVKSARPGKDAVPLLRVENLTLSYPRPKTFFWQKPAHKRVVNGASFTVHEGEVIGIAGASGCGKSTLLKGLVNLISPDGGAINLIRQAHSVSASTINAHPIQIVFQDPKGSLNPRHTLLQSLTEPLHHRHDLSTDKKRDRAAQALTAVGLSPVMLDRLPQALSGGQRQRVAIARAIIGDPDIVLFDEAVSALDPDHQQMIMDLIHTLTTERAMAGIFVSHDLRFLRQLCSTILMTSEGSIVETLAHDQPLLAARHPASRALIEATPGLEVERYADGSV
ncbi:MAG: ABC transporter ATP-binding protein [Pseudomonadota bacterium]